ncbi:hypothetical protein O185_06965 [Photorhabdus temperata J3]|uniref:Uncharacterized protein n=1 Tax=Photorhabdus temperata J3 TaxID=1389415 RepID=U7R2D6_PHOTE|nr:hypothetical protein O185_06965 [Photorhabdus temperata J3]
MIGLNVIAIKNNRNALVHPERFVEPLKFAGLNCEVIMNAVRGLNAPVQFIRTDRAFILFPEENKNLVMLVK